MKSQGRKLMTTLTVAIKGLDDLEFFGAGVGKDCYAAFVLWR
ncbi:MAG: hypothetical protein ACI93R_000223 [Flavobacteriales bacterium]|jgi:hypothetical protein